MPSQPSTFLIASQNYVTQDQNQSFILSVMEGSRYSKAVLPVPSLSGHHASLHSTSESQENSSLPRSANFETKESHSIVELHKDTLDHLSEKEKKIISRELDLPSVAVSYRMLFRYASRVDLIILFVSVICSAASGAIMPLMTVFFGQFAGSFQNYFSRSASDAYFQHRLNSLTLSFIYLGIGQFVAIYIAAAGFLYAGEHATQKLREAYLAAILRQNISFFEKLGAGEITSTITTNMDLVQLGISEKVGITITAFSTFIAALIVGLVKSWRLSCVLLSVVAAVMLVMGSASVFIVKYSKGALNAYSVGGAVAEESISSIRTATAFNGQEKLSKRYEYSLAETMKWGFKTKIAISGMIAGMMFVMFLDYGLSFWEGSRLLVAGYSNLGDTLTVLLSMLMAAVSTAHAAPHVRAFGEALAAASNIFKIIDRPMLSDHASGSFTPTHIEGRLEFRNVKQIYPSRPEITVLEDFSLVIPAGKVTALVGTSGSGKSTLIGLIERFYTPVGGKVILDSHDIQTLDVQWLRRQMSLVGQEPVLFNCTIRNNIEYGLVGTELEEIGPEKKSELVIQAAKMANAHNFISELPDGYETIAGNRGHLLSGGQKQRIAIARAVISNPKILLLDEATSALDSQSEGVVQEALDNASQVRTTVVVAHRLSTIKRADNIVVLSKGRIIEQGTHDELISLNRVYHDLVEAQSLAGTGSAQEHQVDQPLVEGSRIEGHIISADHASTVIVDGDQHDDSLWSIMKFILGFNRQDVSIMFIGLCCSILAGGGMPVQGVLFAKCIEALSQPDYGKLRSDINFWSLMFIIVAFAIFAVTASHGIAFAYCSERLIYRARDLGFRSILRQDISFFDQDVNAAGALTTSLSKGANDLAGISGATLGALLNLVTTIVSAVVLSCIVGWKLALVCSSTIPVLLACGFLRLWVLSRLEIRAGKAYQSSAAIACEAVSAIPTIASLNREKDVWDTYHNMLQEQLTRSRQSILKTSVLYAASQSFALFCMSLGFWYGGRLIVAGEYSMFQFFVCFNCIIFSTQSAGALFSFAPDMAKSRHAAQQLKNLCNRVPEIDTWSKEGKSLKTVRGNIEFKNVFFSYPTRGAPILQGLSLTIKPGQFIALVGHSGCGKSTIMSLLERFYSPTNGQILIDGQDISTLHVKEYRSHIPLVSQEPALYSGTMRENICLGVDGDVEEESIARACRDANIWDFIQSLPQNLSTPIGPKGLLLSGGQKQRLALARALLTKPKVLLLDEATSALDSESEKVVQEALDKAAREEGRTTIAVAHRLSTIKDADCIFVLEGGRVVEAGTHGELLARKDRYAEMVWRQRVGV